MVTGDIAVCAAPRQLSVQREDGGVVVLEDKEGRIQFHKRGRVGRQQEHDPEAAGSEPDEEAGTERSAGEWRVEVMGGQLRSNKWYVCYMNYEIAHWHR